MSSFLEDTNYIGPAFFKFDGVDYGFTVESAEWEYVEDIVDIMSSQFGSQPFDKVQTGQAYLLRVSFGRVSNELYAAMTRGATVSSSGKAIKFACELYKSGYENYAKQLQFIRASSDECNTPSADPNDRILWLKAMPTITGPLVYDAETQRKLDVEFYCFIDQDQKVFGYGGTQTSNGLSGIIEL
jgi:hypothetical protein